MSEQTDEYVLRGNTMGTSYTIKALHARGKVDEEALYNDIKATLDEANEDLSNWIEDSSITRFNESHSTNWQQISPHFFEVLQAANEIHTLSGGRFDITVSPLVDLWGFGPKDSKSEPSEAEIEAALANVGQSRLVQIKDNPPMIRKLRSGVTITLGAIAKGYSSDLIGRTLEKHGITNYLVEIGGDLMVHGFNAMGERWRVGIEKPDDTGRSVQMVVPVTDMGIATSGDYRNFYLDSEGRRKSHIIDPVSGRPVTHSLASVTVLAPDGKDADGWATALLALGEADGRALADKLDIPAYFIRREAGGFETSASKAFEALMSEAK
ncbi:FAD:protein FMN transferase [uncultured Cohaesibacter sp.]|uniref:FAD:protein FMN transferase n=1 Tax=uncultured Cohaesibacter sp. TaxID=1002546 RepID=UPI0029301ED2|nr:FAD:protein FMN transferase [uncultured Cohaesibacter sp.]